MWTTKVEGGRFIHSGLCTSSPPSRLLRDSAGNKRLCWFIPFDMNNTVFFLTRTKVVRLGSYCQLGRQLAPSTTYVNSGKFLRDYQQNLAISECQKKNGKCYFMIKEFPFYKTLLFLSVFRLGPLYREENASLFHWRKIISYFRYISSFVSVISV